MYDIKPLEQKWEHYRRKKRRPYIVAGILLLLLGGGSASFYYLKMHGGTNSEQKRVEKKKEPPVVFMEDGALKDLQENFSGEEVHISDSISDEIVEDLPLTDTAKKVQKRPRVKMDIVTTDMPGVAVQTERKKEHQRVHLKISESSDSHAYREVAQRFRETQDTDDSLFLAKAYYNQKKYKKAAYWALQTNNINNGIEESVLIFAQAKAKLGHRNEAIRILSEYIRQSGSNKAKDILVKIKKRKI